MFKFNFFILSSLTGSIANNLSVQRMVWDFIGSTPLYKPTKCYSWFLDACICCRFALVIFIRIFLKENDVNILISGRMYMLSFSYAFSWKKMMLISWFLDACICCRFALVIFIRIFLKENDVNILISGRMYMLSFCTCHFHTHFLERKWC